MSFEIGGNTYNKKGLKIGNTYFTPVSISASYSGANPTAGAAVSSLAGNVTVKAAFEGIGLTNVTVSDWSFKNGAAVIVEGANSVTVVWNGLECSFNVTGAEAAPTAYSLSISATHATVSVTSGGMAITAGTAIYAGDVLTISATADGGYTNPTITVNGTAFTSGSTHSVSGDVAIVAVASADENPEPDEGQIINYDSASVQNNGQNIYVNFSTAFNLAGYDRIEVYLEREGGWGGTDGFGGKNNKTGYAAYEPDGNGNWNCIEFDSIDPAAKPVITITGVMTLDTDGKRLVCGCPRYSAAIWAYTGSPIITVKGFAV